MWLMRGMLMLGRWRGVRGGGRWRRGGCLLLMTWILGLVRIVFLGRDLEGRKEKGKGERARRVRDAAVVCVR